MSDEARQWLAMALVFASGLATLAGEFLPVSPELQPWLAFFAAAVDLALVVFFGRAAVKAHKAKAASK